MSVVKMKRSVLSYEPRKKPDRDQQRRGKSEKEKKSRPFGHTFLRFKEVRLSYSFFMRWRSGQKIMAPTSARNENLVKGD
jgi:hypothetical protein